MARNDRHPPTLDYGRPGRDGSRSHRHFLANDHGDRRGDERKPPRRRRGGCFMIVMILYLIVGATLALVGGWYVFGGGLTRMLDR